MKSISPLECGKLYHLYNRGNNKEDLFIEDRNYLHFMKLWEKHIYPVAETFAYCLLKNHFHFLIRVRENILTDISQEINNSKNSVELSPKIVAQHFSNFFNAYTKSINKAYGRTGSLFQERFSRKEVSREIYFTRLIHYIHTNPQKHGFVEDFRDWQYSSYHGHLSEFSTKLERSQVLNWFGDKTQYTQFHKWDKDFLSQKWDTLEE